MRTEEQVRQIRGLGIDEATKRAAISELHRREALQAVGKVEAVAPAKTGGTWDALLKTPAGVALIEAKKAKTEQARIALDRTVEAERIRRFNESRRIAGRIRQIKELAFDVLVRKGHAKPVYEQYKGKLRLIGERGGQAYDETLQVLQTKSVSEVDDYFHFVA